MQRVKPARLPGPGEALQAPEADVDVEDDAPRAHAPNLQVRVAGDEPKVAGRDVPSVLSEAVETLVQGQLREDPSRGWRSRDLLRPQRSMRLRGLTEARS
jgi:hypothetical protein